MSVTVLLPGRELLLELMVLGQPFAKRRARVTRHGTFTPAATRHAEEAIEWHMKATGVSPIRRPVVVDLDFFLGNRRRVDLDNLVKLVVDAGNGIVWVDDNQIVGFHAFKFVDRERPRTELRVWALPDG